jgi:hypothetical protein
MRRCRRVRHGLLALAAGALLCGLTPSASAAPYTITLVARSCPDYPDVMANRARNDIQESLRDLGKDTAYPLDGSVPISPAIEEANDPNCSPITGWEFKFGDGINGTDNGPWGSLSKVRNPINHSLVTLPSTPLLNKFGAPVGVPIAGAVTVQLSDQESALAARNGLWVQGGVPGDPVLDTRFPDTYGFAALRCAKDNLNGDNVEWVGYPTGTTHVFCFAYYVKPPPTSGTIVIAKKVQVDAGQTYTQNFRFVSNITYNPSGDFLLQVQDNQPASETFFRAQTTTGVAPWSVSEDVPTGWRLQSLTCTSLHHTSTVTTSGGTATITLGALDTVTCTYTDQRDADGPLKIAKETIGGVGAFKVLAELPGVRRARHVITTTAPRDPVTWTTPFTQAGTYRVAERLPPRPDGVWHVLRVACDGVRKPRRTSTTTTMAPASTGSLCTFTNVFRPNGRITVNGITLGDTAKIHWVVDGPSRKPRQFQKRVQTDQPGEPKTASGQPTDHLPLGTYTITQTGIVGGGRPWQLIDIACDGGIVDGVIAGGVRIRLTRRVLHVTCTFTNQALAKPEPPIPPIPPEPPDTGGGGSGGGGSEVIPVPKPAPTPPAHFVRRRARALPAGAVQTGFGPAGRVPSVFRATSPDHRLLQAAGGQVSRDPRVARGHRSRVDAMVVRVARLGIRGRLQRLDTTADHQLRVPADPRRVGWWSGGALPGARGSTVLAGHVDGPAGPAVFNRLQFARRGDLITISRRGHHALRYHVTGVREYRKGRLPRQLVFGASRTNRLRLVTCGGRFNAAIGSYDDNIVVYASLI